MCGIAGIFDGKGRREMDRALLVRMNESQLHRGPDEGGVHLEPGVALAHRRLSIIDLSTGQQPLYNEDGSVCVIFNGEIYNFQELVTELAACGHSFRTHSDTEVIVHGWEEWGEACVKRFRGMFAFALWDRNRETLFLARDRLGVKPLYYAQLADGCWIFGSELKALLVHPRLPREIDPLAVEEYFAYGYVPEPRTVFKGVYKLGPGCTLALRRGEPPARPVQYWDAPFKPSAPITEEEAGAELVRRLRESVKLRMISDVPLGAFLSGGVDSSAVVAMMAGLSADPVVTCSISFGDPAFNESAYAQAVADRYRTRHHVEQVDPDDFSLVDRLAALYDEPYADSSAIPTYRVCELARKSVIVALSGDGGDENFGGYRRYRWHMNEERVRSLLPLNVRRPVFGLLGQLYPKADWAPRVFRAKSTFQALARNSVEAYFHSVSILHDGMRRELFSDRFRSDLQGYSAVEVLKGHAARAPSDHPLSLIQYLDLKTYLVGDINTKVDRASMAHSLEVREPLMDHPLVEWLSGLPPDLKLRGGEGKYLLKRSLEPYLSDEILYRPKMGFSVPLARWFRGPLRQSVRNAVLGPVLADTGWFNAGYLRRLVDEHQSGLRDYSATLWTVLMFESFLRKVMERSPPRPPWRSAIEEMRVIHILDHSIPLHSGYAFRTLSILREQRALGWETFHVTGPKQGAGTERDEVVDGWHFYRTPPPGGILEGVPGLSEIELMGEIASRVEHVARRVRPHILHAHSPVLNAIPALWVARRLGVPVVYEVRAFWEDAAVDHGTEREWGLRYRLSRTLETWALRRADAVTTICEGLRNEIVGRGIPPSRVTVIPNAVDIDGFTAGGVSDPALRMQLGLQDGLVLGFIGSFYAYEGLSVLLHGLKRLLAQGEKVRVLLVGGGRQEAELKRLAAELGVEDHVIFTGRVPHGEVGRYYDLIDVLVYPRLSMRLTELVTPLKPLEAMAQGRLVIASDVGGHRELVRPGETGELFKAGDPDALAAAVRNISRDPARWPARRAAARRYVENERNWKASVSRYSKVYESVLQASGRA